MAVTDRPEPGVWQQLRRRRVTRTVVTYVAVGFAFLEAVWLAVPALGFVDEVGRIATGAVVLGFPLAVVLAWTYDVTPRGIVRTPDEAIADPAEPRPPLIRRSAWLLLCGALIAAGFILLALRM